MATEDSQDIITATSTDTADFTMNFTAASEGYVSEFQMGTSDGGSNTGTLSIIQNSVELASTSTGSWTYNTAPLITFNSGDYFSSCY